MTRLKDICELIVDCEHKTAPTQDGGYPSIRTPKFGKGRLILDDVNRVSEETYRLWTQRETPQSGDLILAREAPIGNVAIIPPGLKVCLGQRTVLIRADRKAVNPRYLTYLLLGDEIQGRIQSISNGATVHHLNMKDIRNLEMQPLPNHRVQDRIASILSAYDDLIENSTRRIKIAEQMAQMLYREWFVNFRFPGHENAKWVKSDLGPIPEGWKLSDFGSLSVNLDSRQIPLSAMQRANHNRKYPYYGASGIIDQVESYQFDGLHLLISEDGENLRSRKTPIAFLADGKFWVNNHAHVVQGRSPVSTHFLFACLKNADISPYITGTAQPKLSQANLNRIPALLPQGNVLSAFDDLYAPLLKLIGTLSRKNANLCTTRDLLLPKLISGDIPVDTADAALELAEQTA